MEAIYFDGPEAWRAWLEEHHESETEVLVGFFKKHTGRQRMTWSEAVDEALCFGWIDGIGRRVDDERNTIRFTPRKPSSIWSTVNVKKVAALTEQGRMRPAGLAAFERRREDRTAVYSHDRTTEPELTAEQEAALRADAAAWAWFEAQAPSYRRTARHWVSSAKRPETRERRFAQLLACSREG